MHLLSNNLLNVWVETLLLLLNSPLLLNSNLLILFKSNSITFNLGHVTDVAHFSERKVVVLASLTSPVSVSVGGCGHIALLLRFVHWIHVIWVTGPFVCEI